MLFVISAPSGAGKTTIIKELFRKMPELRFSISATTRDKRQDETDKIDYYFISKEDFELKIEKGEFAEWEQVFDNYYGTLKSELEKGLDNRHDLVFDVDVKGALSMKKLFPDAVTIFIEAPKSDLIDRLNQRKTDTREQINKRVERMEMELRLKDKFDYVVMNETNHSGVDKVVSQLIQIINKSKNKQDDN